MPKKRKKTNLVLIVIILLIILAVAIVSILLSSKQKHNQSEISSFPNQQVSASQNASSIPAGSLDSSAKPEDQSGFPAAMLPEEMRAVWISFLEWEKVDISSEEAMRNTARAMFDHSAKMGLNTVIVSVRSFSDALYPSNYYPWSHLLTGFQGKDPGYDPLSTLIEEAHARGLRFEAWINPYRVNSPNNGPPELSPDNPAKQHPEWVREVNGAWLDPGLPEVQKLVADGVAEIVQNYNVDGIHFDDYFYPEFNAEQKSAGEDLAFDSETFDKYGAGNALGEWRRENVNRMVLAAYQAVKTNKPDVSFGISPQGNNENNYQIQYSDIKLWMAKPGYVDYVMPQLYWGFHYRTQSGRDSFAFGNIAQEWAGYQRCEQVKLYAGLGAYRIGAGDGGANDQDEWKSGHNLADMLILLRETTGFSGFSLFRYEFLFTNSDPLATQEAAALSHLLLEGH